MAFLIILTLAVAAVFSAGFVVAMMPILRRYAVARPNVRSSHAEPTPQGAGLAVVLATVLATVIGLVFAGPGNDVAREAAIVLVASLILAATGAIDDLRPLGPFAKLVPQVLAVALVIVFAAPADARLFPVLPFALERVLAVLAGVWFVNLVNFMDGIDWITVAGCGVPLAALAVLGGMTISQGVAAPLLAGALCGALIGFSPFNKPVARVFLGDVGSLPIGLILGYGLYRLALAGHLAAALILPLYYLWIQVRPSFGACRAASPSGRRIAAMSTSARPMQDGVSPPWWGRSSSSISCSAGLPSSASGKIPCPFRR